MKAKNIEFSYISTISFFIISIFLLFFINTYSFAQTDEESDQTIIVPTTQSTTSPAIQENSRQENNDSTQQRQESTEENVVTETIKVDKNDDIVTITDSPRETSSFSPEISSVESKLLPIPGEIDKSTTSYAILDNNGELIAGLNEDQQYPSLSLVKVLLGYWVFNHGEDIDKPLVENMIRSSNDFIATYLDEKYPEAINNIINDFGLENTHRKEFWGDTYTTAYDTSKFLYGLNFSPNGTIIVDYMRAYDGIAADGTAQNYGVAKIPDNHGVKFGWSNEHDYTSTTGYIGENPDYVISVFSIGNENKNTYDSLFAWKSIDPSFVVPSDIILNADEDINYPEKKDIDINQSPFKISDENIKNETLNNISEEEKSNPIKYYVIILLLFISLICSLAYIIRQKMLNKTYNDKGGKYVTT